MGGDPRDAAQKLREGSLVYLKQVANGDLSIGDETGGDEIQTSPGVVMEEGPERVMTRDRLRSF